MRLKSAIAISAALTLAATVGASIVFASPAQSEQASSHDPAGLSQQGVENARRAGLPNRLVKLAPQSNVQLLSGAEKVGPHAPESEIDLVVGLKLRNVAKLKSFLQQVQNPASPLYHQWLTPEEFTRRYGPTKTEVQQVVNHLEARGITVEKVSENRTLIHTRATTADYEHAFGIQVNDYKLAGRSFYSTEQAPMLPRGIAPLVNTVMGLNHAVQMQPHHFYQPGMVAHDVSPHAVTPPAASLTKLSPLQIATAYNVPDITQASQADGVSIAVVTAASRNVATNTIYSDFWQAYGLPDHQINVIPIGGPPQSDAGGVETTLDIDYSGAMAPGATLNVYVSATTQIDQFAVGYNQMVIDNTSDVMTVSWGLYESGLGESYIRATEQIFMQATAQGISLFAAAGDYGTADRGPGLNNADYPSSSQYVVAANGTQLTIADLSGSYGSEVVWDDPRCFGQKAMATGGAISDFINRPTWQQGPGMPGDVDMLMNSNVALTASCSKPMALYTGGWGYISGTSAVAPMLAGIFAQAVNRNGGSRLGQANKLLYAVANSHYATDFHDVTQGCNGRLPDGTSSCATANWDHPTGWGSLNVTSLLSHIGIHGPKGTLTGAVTDALSGDPVAGAVVTAVSTVDGQEYVATVADDGSYSRLLPAGNFDVTVSSFGYSEGTASVSIIDGGATMQDFALQTAPNATLSGKVSDGSGHGYGLYAHIHISVVGNDFVSDAWTDPATGQYSVELPSGFEYTMTIATVMNGHHSLSGSMMISGDTTQDFALPITPACTAPGYTFATGGFSEDFNGGTFPPAGWSVENAIADSTVVWKSNSAWGGDNWTGGSGQAAAVNSGVAGQGDGWRGPHDTALITPPIAVSSLKGATVLRYQANFQSYLGDDSLDVAISTDGGANWTTFGHWQANHGVAYGLPGEAVQVNIAPYLPASGTFQLRWRNYDLNGYHWDRYAQIDNVRIGRCVAVKGGLVTGQVVDALSGDGLQGATVSTRQGQSTKTLSNPADADFPVGSYVFFVPATAQTLTARLSSYLDSQPAEVKNNGIVVRDFSIERPEFTVDQSQLTLDVTVNTPVTKTLTISNAGQGAGEYKVIGIDAPLPAHASTPMRSLQGQFAMASPSFARAHGLGAGADVSEAPRAWRAVPRATSSDWQRIANYPLGVQDVVAATDPDSGKVYAIGGSGPLNAGYVYDPAIGSWSSMAPMRLARAGAAVAFIDGKLYVANGWGVSGDPVAALAIYDPATDSWSQGAPNPAPVGGGSASAVVNGYFYVIGGCGDGSCSRQFGSVQVYDPGNNAWHSAPDYPHTVTFLMCGGIAGKLYCAGGGGSTYHAEAYVYDPQKPTAGWLPVAGIPVQNGGLWGAGYTVSHGELLVSGGVTNNAQTITNQGWSYDPATDSWTALPNALYATYRGASACGFYRIGGGNVQGEPSGFAQVLPGYEQCESDAMAMVWLTATPPSGIIDSGDSTQVTLTFDAPQTLQGTTSRAYLKVVGAPHAATVALTVNWKAQPVDLEVSGSVSPVGAVEQGDLLSYNLVVRNLDGADTARATATRLIYELPQGVEYMASSGQAACTLSSATLTCDVGALAPGSGKTLLLTVKALENAESVSGTFSVASDEPDADDSNNTVTIATTNNAGPPGPTGPTGPDNPGPRGPKGSGGFGAFMLLALLGLTIVGARKWTRRRVSDGPVSRGKNGGRGVKAALLPLLLLPFALGSGVASAAPGNASSANSLVWLQQQKLVDSDGGTSNLFGQAVAVSGDTALVGVVGKTVDGNPTEGVAFIYTRKDGVWSEPAELTAGDGSAKINFGRSVALSGNIAVVGASRGISKTGADAGAAYVFSNASGSWTQVAKLVADDGDSGDLFGWALAVKQGTILVAARQADAAGHSGQGAVYVFNKVNGQWTQTDKLTSNDGYPSDGFGVSVAMDGSTALIGAFNADPGGVLFRGAAYVFKFVNGHWQQAQKLLASDGRDGDFFGFSVALSGNTALVGVPRGLTPSASQGPGMVYVFTNQGGHWIRTAKLLADDGAIHDLFGWSLALSGTTAVIGAKGATIGSHILEGAAYVFEGANRNWRQLAKLNGLDGDATDQFGSAVALSNDTLMVGAPNTQIGQDHFQGKAYLFGRVDFDLAVSAPAAVSAADSYVSQAIVTNASTQTFASVALTVAIPSAASFVSANATHGSCNQTAGIVRCDFGTLKGNAASASANVTIKAPDNAHLAALDYSSSLVGAAPALTVSGTTKVESLAVDLAVSGTVGPVGPIHQGDELVYNLVVQNRAAADARQATGVELSYELPAGIVYLAASDDAGCTSSEDQVLCNIGTLPAGQDELVKLVIRATTDMDALAGTFTASAVEDDMNSADNSVTLKVDTHSGPQGPEGPQGPKPPPGPQGPKGSGGFGGLVLLAFLGLALAAGLRRRRRRDGMRACADSSGWGNRMNAGVKALVLPFVALPLVLGGTAALADTLAGNDAEAHYSSVANSLVWLGEQKVSTGEKGYYFGWDVAVSGDTAVISASKATLQSNRSQGTVYVYTNTDGVWTQTAELTAGDAGYAASVAISGDTILVGDTGASTGGFFGHRTPGAVYVFEKSGGSWSQTHKLVPTDSANGDMFGLSVVMSGTTAVISATGKEAVYVFDKSGAAWSQTAKLSAGDASFGVDLAISGDTIVVGDNGVASGLFGPRSPGSAYMFSRSSGTWSQVAKLVPSDSAADDNFGVSVALSGNVALVGAVPSGLGDVPPGAVYVFTGSGGTWSQVAKLVPEDSSNGDKFGADIAMAGSTALIGSNGVEAAYVFSNASGSAWHQTVKLEPGDAEPLANYGSSVALTDATGLVGAFSDRIDGATVGSAFFYGRANLGLNVSAPAAVSAASVFVNQAIVTNASSLDAAVSVAMPVPPAASFVSANATQGSCSKAGGIVTCDFGALAGNGGKATANLTLKAPGNAQARPLEQTANVLEAVPALTASAVSTIDLLPVNLAIGANVSPATGPITQGDNLTYVVVVNNLSVDKPRAATQVHLSYDLPQGVAYVGAGADGACSATGGSVTCALDTIGANSSRLTKLIVKATDDMDSIASTFTVSAEENDPDMANNTVNVTTDPDYGPTGPGGPTGPPGEQPVGPKGPSGSGAMNWWALTALLGLGLTAAVAGRQRRRADANS